MILITGSLAFDYVMDFPGKFADHIMPEKIHMLNVSFLVREMKKGFGGTAGNISYNLSLLGLKSSLLATVGQDFSPYRQFLERNGIDTSYIKIVESGYTSTAFGITDKSDNQIWGFYTGADEMSDKLSIDSVKDKIKFGIIAPNNPKAMIKFAAEYKKYKIPYLFDPGMQLPHLNVSELNTATAGAKIIIGNDYEIALMKKKLGISHEKLLKLTPIVITTLGGKGSIIESNNSSFWGAQRLQNLDSGQARMTGENKLRIKVKAAVPKNTSDPTGAGDAYRAGFVAGFTRGFDLKTCGQMGATCAAYTVEKYGTQTHKFTKEEFSQRYLENFGGKLTL